MLCDILRLANGQIATVSADSYLMEDMELLSDLSNHNCKIVSDLALDVDKKEWKQCDYLFHALFWALREKVPFKVLQNLSDEKILLLKDAISIARQRERPTEQDVTIAGQLGKEYCRQNDNAKFNDIKKTKNNIIRFSAFLTVTVAKNWDEIVDEMNRWSDYVDERVAVSSLIGVKKVRPLNLPINLNPNAVAPIIPAFVEKEKQQNIAKQTNGADEELWSTERLAHELGLKNIMSFHTKKSVFLKKHPEAKEKLDDWFSGSQPGVKKRALFKAKYFQELKQLMYQSEKNKSKAEIIHDVPDGLWSIEKLAIKLGYKNEYNFSKTKTVLLKRYPEYQKQIKDWFIRRGKWKYFKSEHFEELKKIFEMHKRSNSTVRTAVVKNTQIESEKIGTTSANEVNTEASAGCIEQPTDLVGIKALEVYLGQLKELYAKACTDQKSATENYENLQKQMQSAKEQMENATKHTEKIQADIDKTTDLLTEYTQAEKIFAEKQEKLNNFLCANMGLQK